MEENSKELIKAHEEEKASKKQKKAKNSKVLSANTVSEIEEEN